VQASAGRSGGGKKKKEKKEGSAPTTRAGAIYLAAGAARFGSVCADVNYCF